MTRSTPQTISIPPPQYYRVNNTENEDSETESKNGSDESLSMDDEDSSHGSDTDSLEDSEEQLNRPDSFGDDVNVHTEQLLADIGTSPTCHPTTTKI